MSSINVTKIDGDATVGRNVAVGGDAIVQGNTHIKGRVRIDGWLEAENIKGFAKGLFSSAGDLSKAYPRPEDGWVAFVGPTLPAQIYLAKSGKWTGQTDIEGNPIMGGSISIDPSGVFSDLESLKQDVVQLTQKNSQQDEKIETLNEFKETKGKPGGIASLDPSGKVPVACMPNDVHDILEYENWQDFPVEGEADKAYVDRQSNKMYRWNGSKYVVLGSDLELGDTPVTAFPGNRGVSLELKVKKLEDSHQLMSASAYDQLEEKLDGTVYLTFEDEEA